MSPRHRLAATTLALGLLAAAPRALAAEPEEPASPSTEALAATAPDAPAPAPAAPLPVPPPAAPALGQAMGEEVVVTATRSPRTLRDVPATATVVTPAQIERSPSKTLDELLRVVPSFNLFRRSSSVSADPSSVGVKLRNVGSSAVSRALVLVDGIPANDGFGGWVAWRSLPRIGLERIEVVPGGGSALYGNYALSGVIQAFSRPIGQRELDVASEAGSFGTAQVSARAADRLGGLGAELEGEFLTSDGYRVVSPSARGAIDGDTPSKHETVRLRLESQATSRLTFDLRSGLFHEELNGGTTYTTSMVRRLEYAGGAHYRAEEGGGVDLTLFGHHGDFKQERTRVGNVPTPRASEALSARQDVPADDLGASLLWRSRPLSLGGTHALSAGADARWIRGTTREALFPPPPLGATTVVERDAGGEQRLYGVFAQDLYDLSEALSASLAIRWDRWENLDGSRVESHPIDAPATSLFAARTGGQLSPKLGLRARLADWLSARASAYQAFRAPTPDELSRPFQVGTVRTEANAGLTPERLQGAEAGIDLGGPRGPTARVTGFWNEIKDPIINATTGVNARQRQNLGRARIQGLEADAAWPFLDHWSAAAAYTLADTRVTSAPGQPQLVGKQLPQAPRHMATASLAFDEPRLLTADVQLRYLGRQYEDDVNALPMGQALLVDLFATWHVHPRLDLYAAVENLLDTTYLVGRAGVDTIGQPRFVHGGLRVQLGR